MVETNGVTARVDARFVGGLVGIVSILIIVIGSLIAIIYNNIKDNITDKTKQNKDYYIEQTTEIRQDTRNLAVDIASINAKLGDLKTKVEVIANSINRDREGDDGKDGGKKTRGLR